MHETETRVRRAFDVWNEVPLVPQLTGMSCWAAAAAMIIGWRDRVVVDPAAVASGAGRWQAYRGGLHPGDVDSLAAAWGLQAEAGEAWTLEDLRRTLIRHGPVWLGEASPGLHSVVVAGMHGDGTPDGTWVRVNDPWPVGRGERYSLPWRTLSENFRAAGTLLGVRAHVLHAGGRRGSSRARTAESRVTRSRRTFFLSPDREVPMRYGTGWSPPHPDDYASAGGPDAAVAAALAAPGERYLNTTAAGSADPLRGHAGTGDNLYLAWNDVPDDAAEVDVVIHLHGFSSAAPDASLTRGKAAASGLRLAGRARPTLAIMPRGRKITAEEIRAETAAHPTRPPNPKRYTFPALLAGNGTGLERLIDWSLDWFAREILHRPAAPRRGRILLTAHSGGGSPLNRLLGWRASRPACNPHEVHVFDAFYGDTDGVEGWAAERLRAGDGALRVFYGSGTRTGSLSVARGLPAAGDPRRDAFRVEATGFGHDLIPNTFGPALLRDARATLPLNPAPARGHALDVRGYPIVGEGGYAASLAVDDDVRAWLAAAPADRAPLAASVASWIAATDRSGIELIADATRRSHFLTGVDWSQTDFPGNDRNRSTESDALFNTLVRAVPERRVPSIRYHDVDAVVQAVPGETAYRLYPEAKDAYVRMRTAAAADGVTLRIGSAWRSRATQAGIAAGNRNAAAVAQRVSAHSYGLAIDLLLSVTGLRVSEITTRPMSNVIAMYRSPVYKWMALHAREHGFFPYRREPWHWEYNPPGFQARFEGSGASASAHGYGQVYGAPLGLFERYPSAAVLDAADGYAPPRPWEADGGYEEDSGAVALQAPPAMDWCALRHTVSRLARAEERRWTAPNGTKLLENAASQLPILTEYWRTVPGFGTAAAAAAQAAVSAADTPGGEWSAAFICFVMNRAGVQRAHGFEFSGRHMNYIVGALRNRERSQTDRPFWLVDEIELVNEATVEPGDLLCMNRRVNGAWTTHSYSSLRRAFWENGNQNAAVTGSSHCTLVVGIGSDASGRFAETIGGNEGGSVRLNRYGRIALNASGGIANPAAHRIFGMIKQTGCR